MKTPTRKAGILLATLSAAMLVGCSSDSDPASTESFVRVIHASSDAPPVNVKLDGTVAISDLDYAESSGFATIAPATLDVAVEGIIPGGNADVIEVDDFVFSGDARTTIIAVNAVSNIEPLVAEETASSPSGTEVGVAVVHASNVAGLVDVYVTEPGADITGVDPNFTFDFKDVEDAGALPAATYQVRVTGSGSKDVAYDSGAVDLSGFAGQKLMLVAVNTVNSVAKDASPVKVMAYTDSAQVELLDTDTETAARVVHLSPDTGPAEVFATSDALPGSPVELIDSFDYTDIVPAGGDSYVFVPAGDYVFDVTTAGSGIGSGIVTDPTPLAAGTEYTVVAAGYLSAGDPALGLLLTVDDNRSIATQASVKVIHAAPLADVVGGGSVDVYVTPAGDFTADQVLNGAAGDLLLPGFTFGTITDYVPVPADSYDIRVVAGGSVAIDVTADLAAGSVTTVIAREPVNGGDPSDFNVVVLTN